ncbi:MAG: chloride channel protein [bacterium]
MKRNHSNNDIDKKDKGKFGYGFIQLFQMFFRRIPSLLQYTILTSRPAIDAIGNIRKYRHTDWGLLFTSSILGIIIGLFVTLFHWSMTGAEQLFNNIHFTAETVIPWQIIAFPLIPALGGLGIGVLRQTIFKGATVEGLESLVHALVHREGKIDWRNSFKAIIFAGLLIGSGGGAGREGPTIALGSSLGSTFAQILRLKPQQLRVLCGSGAAAAISAIFNAPLGGIVFALEAIIGGISIRAFAPLVISSVLATATTRILVGNNPLLLAPEITAVNLTDYLLLAIAGMLSGLVAVYYLKTYNGTAKIVEKTIRPFPEIWKPAVGGFFAGLILMALPTMLETTYNPINHVISGNGLPLLQNSIFQNLTRHFTKENLIFLFILIASLTVIIKPVSNAISLVSSKAGGTMAPVLKTGAMFGFVLGSLLQFVFPDISPGLFAIVCTGAVLAGTFQLPLAGGIILFEICHNYDLILPLIFSSVFASFIVQKSGVTTFNPLQKEYVDDDEQIHPRLKIND